MLDDIAARRPWNLVVKASRAWARLHQNRLIPGVTVVIVNWNTRAVLEDVIETVKRLSPTNVRILVVDNGSTDGSRNMLRHAGRIRTLLLPWNAGHGVALDLAMSRVRTTVAVTLDSDAIPLRAGWLDPAVEPVMSGRAVVAGLRSSRNFVHPVYCAVNTAAFIRRRLSFQVHRLPDDGPDRWGENAWDTGELLTARLGPDEVTFVERTPNAAPGLPGMTTGEVVYHHGGVSRASGGSVADDGLREWRRACASLGLTFDRSSR